MEKFKIIKINSSRWEEYKKLRLEALELEPVSFGYDYEDYLTKDDFYWQNIKFENLFFVEINSKLIGMIELNFCEGKKVQHLSYISKFYVKKEFRSLGVGKKLFEMAVNELESNSLIKKIKLYVTSNNINAIKLYEKFGFKKIGVQQKELFVKDQYYDEIYMEKLLL